MEAVLIQGAKRTNFITLHMAMEKPGFCSQSVFMQQPEKELAFWRGVVTPDIRSKHIIRVGLESDEIMIFGSGRFVTISGESSVISRYVELNGWH